jgi:hypothetical protein
MHTEQVALFSGQTPALCMGNARFKKDHINGYQDLGFRGFLSPSNNMPVEYRECSMLLFNFLPVSLSLILLLDSP